MDLGRQRGFLLVFFLCISRAQTMHLEHQVNYFVHALSTFLRIRADPSMQIFWISVTVALSDTFLYYYYYLSNSTERWPLVKLQKNHEGKLYPTASGFEHCPQSSLPFPSNAAFCNNSTLTVAAIVFRCCLRFFGIMASAPSTTGTTLILFQTAELIFVRSKVITLIRQ